MDEKQEIMPHNIYIENRERIRITGVTDVGSFDEETLNIFTSFGELTVKGENFQVTELSIDKGELRVDGRIISFMYSENTKKNGGFFARLLG